MAARGVWANVKPMPGRKRRPPFSAFLYRYRNLVESALTEAESTKRCVERLSGRFGPGTSRNNSPRHLQPYSNCDVGCQLNVAHAHSALSNRFLDVRLEVRANP